MLTILEARHITAREACGDIVNIYVRTILDIVRESLREMREEKIDFQKTIDSHLEKLLQAA